MKLEKEYFVDWYLEDKNDEKGSEWETLEKGRFLASFDGEYFNITTVGGSMPYIKVVQLLMDDYRIKGWFDALAKASLGYSNENRKNNYTLLTREGSSGCVDYFIGVKIGMHYIKKYHIMHISMNDKLNQGVHVPLIDFFIFWSLIKNSPAWGEDKEFYLDHVGETVPFEGEFFVPEEIPPFYLRAENPKAEITNGIIEEEL